MKIPTGFINRVLKKFDWVVIRRVDFRYLNRMVAPLELRGHRTSLETKRSVNDAGDPIPWLTYPAIEYLDQLDISDWEILEFGAGASSQYFIPRAKKLVSIEHDPDWVAHVSTFFTGDHKLFAATDDNYVQKALDTRQSFDLILVDGIKRDKCIEVIPELIKPDGMAILDNSERHPELCQKMRSWGFLEVDMFGYCPGAKHISSTSFFFQPNCRPVPKNIQPVIPIAGIKS